MNHADKVLYFSHEINRIVNNYFENDSESNTLFGKICFFGLALHPNRGDLFNFDILSLYNYFAERPHIEARIHDPHIRGSEGIAYGVYLGRQHPEDRWTYEFDVLVLSTPHLFYLNNITKLAYVLRGDKQCLFLDLFGAFTSVVSIGDHIDYVNCSDITNRWEISGGFQSPKRVN